MWMLQRSRGRLSLSMRRARSFYSTWTPAQRRLLQQALTHVPEYGWTQDALAAAASSSNQSIAMAGLLQAPGDIVSFCMEDWNGRLRSELAGRLENDEDWKNGSHLYRIRRAFQLRLGYQKEMMRAERWHEAVAFGVRPENVLTTTQQLEDMVDIVVCEACRDSEALNTLEQLGLGAVYVATELHMLASSSSSDDDDADTWAFLQQQLEQWERLRGITPDFVGSPSAAFYVTSSVASAFASGIASLVIPPSFDSVVSSSSKEN
jgi:rpsU-divergently transcribed protein